MVLFLKEIVKIIIKIQKFNTMEAKLSMKSLFQNNNLKDLLLKHWCLIIWGFNTSCASLLVNLKIRTL